MDDNKFQLGNFSDMDDPSLAKDSGDGFEDLDEPENKQPSDRPASPELQRGEQASQEKSESGKTEIVPLPDNYLAITRHPTETRSEQPSFASPHDGSILSEIAVADIVPNEFQPRRIFNAEKLQELADSIREHGIIQPLVVTKREDGKHEILVGERRFRAAKLVGLPKVPVFVRDRVSQQVKLEVALIENVQRADLNPIEEGKAYEQLREEFGLSVGEIAKRVGKSTPAVSNLMRLLKLPAEVQRALVEEEINEGQARPLLSLQNTEEILQMFQVVKRNDMKVRDIERKVREIKQRNIKVREMFTPDPFLESLENLLRGKLGTRVAVDRGAKGGKITIEFYSDEELSDIVGKIT